MPELPKKKRASLNKDDSANYKTIPGTGIQEVLSGLSSINKAFAPIIDSHLIVSKFAESLLAAITIPFDQFLEKTLPAYKEITVPFSKFAETFRVVQDFNIRLSEVFSNLAESVFKPFEIFSEVFRRNAEVIDNLFEGIRGFQSFTKTITFNLPTLTFDREFETPAQTLPDKVTEEKETPKEVRSWLEENKFIQFKPKLGIAEYRITIQGEREGDVRIFTQKRQIQDISKVALILPHLTEEKPLLPEFIQGELTKPETVTNTSTSLQFERQEREMSINEENGAFTIFIENLGVSRPITECNWLKMLMFFWKYKSAPPDTIVAKWNNLDKNSFKSRKSRKRDTSYIPQIIRQIYDGIDEYFSLARPYIEIKRNTDGNYITYRLQVYQIPTS